MPSGNSLAVFFLVILLGVVSGLTVKGQSRTNATGTGGIHEIRGRIYLPNGKSLETPLEVELQSTTFSTVKVYTDHGGSYSFQALAPGNYTVVINGGDSFETTREYITIDTEVQGTIRMVPTPKIITVPIYLQQKRGELQRTGVLNAKWSSVPKGAIERYEKGLELVRAEKTAEAVIEFKQAVVISPSFSPAYTELGKIYLKKGQLDEAIISFRSALRIDAKDFDAKLNYGIALLNKKDSAAAETELAEAALMNRSAAAPHYYLGLLFLQRKNLDISQKAFETAKQLKNEKSFPLLHRCLGGIYASKHMNKLAVAELETYINLEPQAKDADRIRQTIADLRSRQN